VVAPGYKYNLSDLAAAIGLHQLRRAEALWVRRGELARAYTERHAWHLYVIRLRPERLRLDRARFVAALAERGVAASVHFIPVHLHSFYRAAFGDRRGTFPRAEGAHDAAVSLPLFTKMSEDDVDYVAAQVREIGQKFS
jgi:dTDP-4-amino-4,6-dideoxygalactose transaminase